MKYVFVAIFGYLGIGYILGSVTGVFAWLFLWPMGLVLVARDEYRNRKFIKRRKKR